MSPARAAMSTMCCPAGSIRCRWVKLACERSRRDLEASQEPDYPYRFDPAKAERVCRFLELFPHSKGKWAAQREPFILEGFQAYLTCELFGWVRKRDDLRRFRKALLLVPRKNGKSDWAARVGLYMLAADGEYGAEVYSGATTEKQAWEVFRPALLMAKATPAFLEHYGVQPFKQSIAISRHGRAVRAADRQAWRRRIAKLRHRRRVS